MLFDIEKFKQSHKTVTSGQLVDAYLSVRDRLHAAWEDSLSDDGDGRESLYRQLKGLDAVIIELLSEVKR